MQRLGVYFGLKLLKGIRNRKKMGWESWSIHEGKFQIYGDVGRISEHTSNYVNYVV